MNCCNDFGQCTQGDHCPARPAAVAPIKLQRRSCDELGICQGHATPCASCSPASPFKPNERERRTPDDTLPTTIWDRITFYGVVGIASACTVVMVCGSLGWAYATFMA